MSERHLHDVLGLAIRECKRAMYDRLKAGQDLAEAMAQFFAELNQQFDAILQSMREVKS